MEYDAERQPPERAIAPNVTCVVVDDHPAVLGTVADLIAQSGFSVVGRARTAAEAKLKIEKRAPTLAIVDLRLPDGSGLDLTRELRRATPTTAVILYTSDAQAWLVPEALAAGARGIVLKGSPLSDLVRALETVASGGTYIDPALTLPD
jgi:DNA-binding NarL/FixJ family response regulator